MTKFSWKALILVLLKLGALAFVGGMVLVHIPEMLYDLGPKTPVPIEKPSELSPQIFTGSSFVSIKGAADFRQAFQYNRYGLSYTYFTIQPYGMHLVVRTYEKVDEDWHDLERFLGKLRPFNSQPFSYRIRQIYRDRFKEEVPEGAFFLGLNDIPGIGGWSVAAMVFATVLWLVLFYFFFVYPRRKKKISNASSVG